MNQIELLVALVISQKLATPGSNPWVTLLLYSHPVVKITETSSWPPATFQRPQNSAASEPFADSRRFCMLRNELAQNHHYVFYHVLYVNDVCMHTITCISFVCICIGIYSAALCICIRLCVDV